MKNKKGFTLIELLAVIFILGIITSIVSVSVLKIINSSEEDTNKIQEKSIISAAKMYVADNLKKCKNGCQIALNLLTDEGYLENNDNSVIDGLVLVEKNGKKYSYNFYKYSNKTDFVINESGAITSYSGNDTKLVIPSSINGVEITTIDSWVFFSKNLTSVVIPNSVTKIGYEAFSANPLTNVRIPDSVIEIDDRAFFSSSLTNLTIPNSVTSIGSEAFHSNGLTSLTLGSSVTYIGAGAFSDNKLTSVTIPNNVTFIDQYAFNDNELESVTIPNSITSIEDGTFESNKLTSVTIPNSVTSIGSAAFASNNLTSVTIPESVTYIGDSAFANNPTLSKIIIKGKTSLDQITNGSYGLIGYESIIEFEP